MAAWRAQGLGWRRGFLTRETLGGARAMEAMETAWGSLVGVVVGLPGRRNVAVERGSPRSSRPA
ncbi:hypothetical protein CFC35_41915 [Streptomyces sp. FBKL.4005]|nr:hypothetical protein CFC35_41915 [Streptomyces sp. FBKL.4005]